MTLEVSNLTLNKTIQNNSLLIKQLYDFIFILMPLILSFVKYILALIEFDYSCWIFMSCKNSNTVGQGMLYIHGSILGFHGNLKSSNCVVTSRWVLQITDFGVHDLRHSAESDSIGEHQYYRSKFLLLTSLRTGPSGGFLSWSIELHK